MLDEKNNKSKWQKYIYIYIYEPSEVNYKINIYIY